MISHEKKFIFIHIPKVAGTSVMTAFEDLDSAADLAALHFDPDDSGKFAPPPPHLRAVDYLRYGYVTQQQFDAYFKFAFVRNPWARLVSEYRYRLYGYRYDFKTFLFEHFPRATWADKYCHVLPQYDFLFDEGGELLVDFVGRLETLQRDFEEVCERLGMPAMELPRQNTSQHVFGRRHDISRCEVLKAIIVKFSPRARRNSLPHYRDYYDEESRDFVASLYRKDIEAFGYEF